MTAAPLLALAARVLAKHRLDAVLIGNAAAALQGATVTTMDFDFIIRDTPANVRKLKNLGLTESLHPGYRLSPRRRAFLERQRLVTEVSA